MPVIGGWFGEDVVDWVGDRVSDAGDVFVDIAKDVPFAPELAGALKDLVNGPFKDIVRSKYGIAVLRALSTTVYGPLAWSIGPQLASIAFAVPGLARGQDFWEAWFTEVSYRAEKSAEYIGGDAAKVATDIKRVVELLLSMPRSEWEGLARRELARRLDVDELTIKLALDIVLGLLPDPADRARFDPVTGKPVVPRVVPSPWERTFAEKRHQSSSVVSRLFGSSPSTATAAGAPVASRSRTSTAGDVALVGLIGAAGAALVWFYASEKR